jgi:tetratricopeptide (TPR) repeat protein
LKWFRKRNISGKPAPGAEVSLRGPRSAFFTGKKRSAARFRMSAAALGLAAAGLTASASLAVWQNPGLLLGAGNGIARWLENAESGSGVEKALYRLMKLPGGEILFRRSPRETRPELTALLNASQKSAGNHAALYSLRAMEDEQALDFESAERDWKAWAEKADDKAAASLDLANFYERRLRPQEELAALEAVGRAAQSQAERWTAVESQRSWQAWERTLRVVEQFALPRAEAQREYAGWEQRYPREKAVYERELAFDLAGKDSSAASALTSHYRQAFPEDAVFPVQAEAEVAAARGQARDGLAVYDRSFEPLWPAELVKSYCELLAKGRQERKTSDALRARLAAHPEGGTEPLKDAAKLFYIDQQQGQLNAAKAVLAEYRTRKDARGAAWDASELYTLGRLLEAVQDFPEAARYYYALATKKSGAEEKGLAGLTRILLTAPEQPLRTGAGNLALYKSIATMDRGPGYLNGILSLFFNSQGPAGEYSEQERLAVPYFHRAKAAELLAELDQRFPNAPERAELHARLMDAYAAYGENDAVVREGTGFLAQFPADARRVDVALAVADIYSRTNQAEKEFALYQNLLKELAARADGVPLGEPGKAYSKPVAGVMPASGARSQQYAQVLDRYLSRLVAMRKLPEALTLLRGELDRNPQDPGLYEKLAQFLDQNSMNAHEEEVYQQAIAQFQNTSFGTGWYDRLARFYLRTKRNADYAALSRKVAGIFSGTDLEDYLRKAPAPDGRLALEVDLYAHERFPHDLTFVRNLLAQYRSRREQAEVEKLLWEHWAESADLRDQLFELLSRSGRLDAQLEALRQQAPEIDKGDWTGLAQSNPAAERFWMESCLWQSRFEQGVGAAEALAAEYPADETLGRQASSLDRSLAYFHPEDTDKAVAIEKRLLSFRPDDLETLARIGDIYADSGRMAEAAPYWTRMAEVRPGNADGYLQSATVFWDYFDFPSALSQLRKGRERLEQPTLFGYQVGAIEESQGNLPGAVREYVAGSLGETPSEESRSRLLALAHRPDLHAAIEAETAALLKPASPSNAAIALRVSVLSAEHRTEDMTRELKQAVAQTESFDVLDALAETSRSHALPEVEEAALRRQIVLTADPVHSLELRYQLVDLLQKRNSAAAMAEVDAAYREHGRMLGVVRATANYDWSHERRTQAVAVLLEAADAAYPELKQNLRLEAAGKLTEMAEYPRARKLLEELLNQSPMDAGIESALADNYARSGDQAGLAAFYQAELEKLQGAALERGEKAARVAQLRRGMMTAAAQLGHWSEAVEEYIELMNASPGDEELAQEAALFAGAHGEREKLLGFYRKTAKDSPRDARWSIVLARLQTALEDYPAAIETYGKAIRVRPEQKDLYLSRAELEERLRRLDEAVADYEQLYKLSYHDPQWMVKTAEARARQGRSAETVRALETAWITGRPPKATNDFEVARRLEQWDMLNEARKYAEQGVESAGVDLLAAPGNQSGVELYARIMARLRQSDTAFTRLAEIRREAANIPLAAVAQQVVKDGLDAVVSENWRKQLARQRTEQATEGFAQALRSMGAVVGEYGAPEEKAQFAAWLEAKRVGVDEKELRAVYLPAAQAAGLADMEARLRWELVQKNRNSGSNEDLNDWLQLQRRRVQLETTGQKLEALAVSVPHRRELSLWQKAVAAYRAAGDSAAELSVMEKQAARGWLGGEELPRYFRLLLGLRPQELTQKATGPAEGSSQKDLADRAAQFLLENGSSDQAMASIAARSNGLPPVWKKAYTGLAGLYLRVHTPQVRAEFNDALGADATIGERIAHPADREQQLAGEIWFYYGSRYGVYLDEEKDAQAEDYLEAELEHTPESAKAYVRLASYSADTGRTDTALADYQHALDLKGDQPAILDSIAELAWKQGRRADALAAWQSAVQRLAAEMDARRVPESFWNDFTQVIGNVAAHGQYAAIDQQVDAMLRVYLARNGNYRTETLLKAGYHAHGDSIQWLLEITAAASDPAHVLNSLQQTGWEDSEAQQGRWIREEQMSRLYAHIVELEQRKTGADEDAYGLEITESRWIRALLDEKKFSEARAQLARIPEEKRKSSRWLELELRLFEAERNLPQLISQWKKHAETAPTAGDLQAAIHALSEPSQRIVMRFAYERALEARELTAPNFLGLAALDLDEGDVPGAVALLKRLTLISSDSWTDIDSATSLLEARHRYAEAITFLQPLAEASPWNAGLKVRLAVAILAGNAQSQPALAALTAVAADPKAKYAERVAAAKALQGHGAPAAGSAELELLARSGCPSAELAGKLYFVEARMAAAACSSSDKLRERLLRAALAAAPDRIDLRLQYLRAAFAAGQDARALVAAAPILESGGSLYGTLSTQGYGAAYNAGDASPQSTPPVVQLKPEEAAKLTRLAIHALEKRHEFEEALRLARNAPQDDLGEETKRLKTAAAREQENDERAPKIHTVLDQASVVRPRLLPDMPFVPKKTVGEGDAE